jgi:hypothetical protein
MGRNVTQKLITADLVEGRMHPGEEIGIRIDQTLTQDATGTLMMLELEDLRLDRVKTRLSVQYVDHNLIQADHRNPDNHVFLESAARRFGLWYSRPGNGVSHPVHQIRSGARLRQAGCNGCIGMGQAPATGRNSLRTVPRNFPGRSGVREDAVYFCSPETATASALHGRITDPRRMGEAIEHPAVIEPENAGAGLEMFIPPPEIPGEVELVKGPNIHSLPRLEPVAAELEGPVLLEVGDHISTDEILSAGAGILPLVFRDPDDGERIEEGDVLQVAGVRAFLEGGGKGLDVRSATRGDAFRVSVPLSRRQRDMILAGSVLNVYRKEREFQTRDKENRMSERKNWIQQARNAVAEWTRAVESMEASAGQGNERYDEALALARHELGMARTHLVRVEEAGREAWDEGRAEIETAWDATRDAMERGLEEIRGAR